MLAKPSVRHAHNRMGAWLDKIARIHAAHVKSPTTKTLTDVASMFNCMIHRLKTKYTKCNYAEHIPVLPYNNHKWRTVVVCLLQSYFPCISVSLRTR